MANLPFRAKLDDILISVSWGDIAMDYFGKSPSWLYHKLDEIDRGDGRGGFTEEELLRFKGALCDLADRIRRTADKL